MEVLPIREFLITFCRFFQLILPRFVVVSVLTTRQQTSVAKRTLNPTYLPKDATFDFPIYLSLADHLGVVELVVWDKDMLKKEYLGEAALLLDDWFVNKETGKERSFGFGEPGNQVTSYLYPSSFINLSLSFYSLSPSTSSLRNRIFLPQVASRLC